MNASDPDEPPATLRPDVPPARPPLAEWCLLLAIIAAMMAGYDSQLFSAWPAGQSVRFVYSIIVLLGVLFGFFGSFVALLKHGNHRGVLVPVVVSWIISGWMLGVFFLHLLAGRGRW